MARPQPPGPAPRTARPGTAAQPKRLHAGVVDRVDNLFDAALPQACLLAGRLLVLDRRARSRRHSAGRRDRRHRLRHQRRCPLPPRPVEPSPDLPANSAVLSGDVSGRPPPARLSLCRRPASIAIETPTKGRGRCSKMTVMPTATGRLKKLSVLKCVEGLRGSASSWLRDTAACPARHCTEMMPVSPSHWRDSSFC